MTYSFDPVDPARDARLIHGWVTQPRAVHWGMLGTEVEEVQAIYAHIHGQDHLSARLMRVEGTPVGILQTYDPFVDEIGKFYDRQPGDLGVHLFLASTPARSGHTAHLFAAGVGMLFAEEGCRRLVLEPDVANISSIALLTRMGATLGPVVALPGKTAQFAFLERQPVAGPLREG